MQGKGGRIVEVTPAAFKLGTVTSAHAAWAKSVVGGEAAKGLTSASAKQAAFNKLPPSEQAPFITARGDAMHAKWLHWSKGGGSATGLEVDCAGAGGGGGRAAASSGDGDKDVWVQCDHCYEWIVLLPGVRPPDEAEGFSCDECADLGVQMLERVAAASGGSGGGGRAAASSGEMLGAAAAAASAARAAAVASAAGQAAACVAAAAESRVAVMMMAAESRGALLRAADESIARARAKKAAATEHLAAATEHLTQLLRQVDLARKEGLAAQREEREALSEEKEALSGREQISDADDSEIAQLAFVAAEERQDVGAAGMMEASDGDDAVPVGGGAPCKRARGSGDQGGLMDTSS
jgi:hypothetical protein